MPRLMSFALTTDAIVSRTKTVTRRLGWRSLQPGTQLWACGKVMGRRPTEPLEKLALIEVTDVRRQPLWKIYDEGREGCRREGFPELTPGEFIDLFCQHMNCCRTDEVTRIEFNYLDSDP